MILLELIAASFLIMLASLAGKITVWKFAGDIIERNLDYLVSFAAGVFLILVFGLSQEVITEAASPTIGFAWFIVGLILVWLATKLIPETHFHYHPDEDSDEPIKNNKLDARRLLIGDSMHNIGDGILLATAFLVTPALGFAAAVSIFFHEIVQEVSEFFILRQAGYTTNGALKINFVTSGTILIGSFGGYFFLSHFALLEVPVLGFAAGALIALLLQDIIPHSVKHAREKKCAHKHIAAALIGSLLMFGIVQITGEHSHEHHDDEVSESASVLIVDTDTLLDDSIQKAQ